MSSPERSRGPGAATFAHEQPFVVHQAADIHPHLLAQRANQQQVASGAEKSSDPVETPLSEVWGSWAGGHEGVGRKPVRPRFLGRQSSRPRTSWRVTEETTARLRDSQTVRAASCGSSPVLRPALVEHVGHVGHVGQLAPVVSLTKVVHREARLNIFRRTT